MISSQLLVGSLSEEKWQIRRLAIVQIAAPQRNVRTSENYGKNGRSSAVFKNLAPQFHLCRIYNR